MCWGFLWCTSDDPSGPQLCYSLLLPASALVGVQSDLAAVQVIGILLVPLALFV
jgi:hypothetical protein